MNTSKNDPLAALEVMRREAHMSRQRAMVSAEEIAAALVSDRATIDALTALVAAARELILAAPAFRSRPLGSKGSDARILQDQHIAAEDALRAALANFPESK